MKAGPVVKLWIRWAIWSGIMLVVFLGLVGFGYCSSIILGGWAVGVVLAATLLLFWRPKARPRHHQRQQHHQHETRAMVYGRR